MAVSLLRLLRLIRTTGRMAEPTPSAPEPTPGRPRALAGSVQIRHVDAGSCNGCEIELGAAFGPVYDVEQDGARLVARTTSKGMTRVRMRQSDVRIGNGHLVRANLQAHVS
jgi:hypothetical protein